MMDLDSTADPQNRHPIEDEDSDLKQVPQMEVISLIPSVNPRSLQLQSLVVCIVFLSRPRGHLRADSGGLQYMRRAAAMDPDRCRCRSENTD